METTVIKAATIKTEPLVEPPDGRLDLVDVFDKASGAPFWAGMCEVYTGNAIDFDYDSDAAPAATTGPSRERYRGRQSIEVRHSLRGRAAP